MLLLLWKCDAICNNNSNYINEKAICLKFIEQWFLKFLWNYSFCFGKTCIDWFDKLHMRKQTIIYFVSFFPSNLDHFHDRLFYGPISIFPKMYHNNLFCLLTYDSSRSFLPRVVKIGRHNYMISYHILNEIL